jgi:NAD(P)-dependent dehydrogenase (short-subunit alcohol dehydrogenase family)
MFELTGKVALVTGAMRGMGKADALVLAKQGAKVVVTDIDLGQCEAVVEEIESDGGEAKAFRMDVSDNDEVNKVFDAVIDAYGQVDILVNNAGIFRPKPALEITKEEWEEMIHINLRGQFTCAQRAAKEMVKTGGGRIINIASIASGQTGVGVAGGTHYTATKGGVLGMTEALAVELAEHNITVNAVAPGAIDTPMLDEAGFNDEAMKGLLAGVPLGRMGTPDEIAAAVVFLASDEASYVTGAVLTVDGGWLAS